MQPAATEIGVACGIEHWAVDLFAEEVIRGGPAFALSLVLSRLDPLLRAEADMGAWQIISPVPAVGYVKHVHSLREVMNETFTRPTVLVAGKVGGDEEIPAGAVAVLTTCSVDVLSHSAVRARNMGCLFATCYDEAVLDSLAALDGEPVSASVMGGDEVVWEEVDASAVPLARAPAMSLACPRASSSPRFPSAASSASRSRSSRRASWAPRLSTPSRSTRASAAVRSRPGLTSPSPWSSLRDHGARSRRRRQRRRQS